MNQGISTQAFSAPFLETSLRCYLKQVCVFKILRAYSNLAIWVSRAFKDSIIVSKWQKINISYEFHQRVIAQRHKKCAAYFIQQWIILSIEQHSLALIITKQDKKNTPATEVWETYASQVPNWHFKWYLQGDSRMLAFCERFTKKGKSLISEVNKRWKLVWGGKTASGRHVRFFSLQNLFWKRSILESPLHCWR